MTWAYCNKMICLGELEWCTFDVFLDSPKQIGPCSSRSMLHLSKPIDLSLGSCLGMPRQRVRLCEFFYFHHDEPETSRLVTLLLFLLFSSLWFAICLVSSSHQNFVREKSLESFFLVDSFSLSMPSSTSCQVLCFDYVLLQSYNFEFKELVLKFYV